MGTLGTVLPWSKLSPFERAGEENRAYRLPPDIKKVASSTTLKVISGVQYSFQGKRTKPTEEREDEGEVEETGTEMKNVFDRPLREPILGKHFELPGRSAIEQRIELDTTQLYVPIYSHLRVHPSDVMENLPAPPIIGQVKGENYLDHYMPVVGKVDPNSSAINIREPHKVVRSKAGGQLGQARASSTWGKPKTNSVLGMPRAESSQGKARASSAKAGVSSGYGRSSFGPNPSRVRSNSPKVSFMSSQVKTDRKPESSPRKAKTSPAKAKSVSSPAKANPVSTSAKARPVSTSVKANPVSTSAKGKPVSTLAKAKPDIMPVNIKPVVRKSSRNAAPVQITTSIAKTQKDKP